METCRFKTTEELLVQLRVEDVLQEGPRGGVSENRERVL